MANSVSVCPKTLVSLSSTTRQTPIAVLATLVEFHDSPELPTTT